MLRIGLDIGGTKTELVALDPGGRATVGIGLPGAVSPATGLVKNAYATPYNRKPLKVDLERLLERELRFENRLARAFAHVINLIDPDIIVIGGGLSRIGRIVDAVPRIWTAFVYSDSVVTKLARAAHGDASGVRGAAYLWDARSG